MPPSLLLISVVMVKGSREDLTATLGRTIACLVILWDRRFHSNEYLFCCIRLKSVRRLIWLRRRTWSGCHVVWTSQFREKNVCCRIHGIHTATVLMRHITHVVPLLKPSCDHLYKENFYFLFYLLLHIGCFTSLWENKEVELIGDIATIFSVCCEVTALAETNHLPLTVFLRL